MPEPKKGEKRNKYVSRAIPEVKKEHPELTHEQIVGRVEGMYTFYTKKRRKKRGEK